MMGRASVVKEDAGNKLKAWRELEELRGKDAARACYSLLVAATEQRDSDLANSLVNLVHTKRRDDVRFYKSYLDILCSTIAAEEEYKIKYWRQPVDGKVVFVTFNTVASGIDAKPFALDFVIGQGFDLVSVSQKYGSFYQGLSGAMFKSLVGPILQNYQIVVFYGSSLGGYAAMYFGAAVPCRVFAVSPRLPMHPIFHRSHWPRAAKRRGFDVDQVLRHEAIAGCNNDAIVLLDPTDKLDWKFFQKVFKKAYPDVKLAPYRFSGHGSLRILKETGELKRFVLSAALEGEIVSFDRSLRKNSPTYLSMVAAHLMDRKPRWAHAILKECRSRWPDNKRVVRLMRRVKKRLSDS